MAGEVGSAGIVYIPLPPGGTQGQVLAKTDTRDYAATWVDPSGTGGAAGSLSAAGVVATLGLIIFSNSPTVSFGLAGQTMTASAAGGGGGGGGVAVSAGTQLGTSGTVKFADSNGISFGLSGSSQLTASYTVPSTAGLISAINVSAGTTSRNLSQLVLGDSNGLAFGLNGSTITGSYTVPSTAGLLSAVNLSAGTTSSNLSAFVLSNSNGISFGLNGGTLTASHNGLTSQSSQVASASNGSFTFQTLAFSNANNVTFGTSAGGIITASVAGAGGAASLSGYATGNTTQSSSGTAALSSLVFNGGGIVSVGISNGSIVISGPDTTSFAPFSVGFSTGGNTAGNTGFGTDQVVFAGGANITLSGSTNAGSMTISIVGAAGGGGGGGVNFGVSTMGNTAGSTGTVSTGNVVLAALGALSLSQSTGAAGSAATISIRGPDVSSLVAGANITISTAGSTISIIGASVAASPLSISAGTTSGALQSIVFSNSNGFSFGLNGSTITGSYTVPSTAGLLSAINLSAGTTSSNLSAFTLSNSNGLAFGLNGGTITGSYTVPSTAGLISAINVSAGTTSNNMSALVLSNSNGLSFGLNGSTITGSYTVPTQTNQTVGLYASSQTVGQSSSSTVDARSISFVGRGNISVGLSAGSFLISGAGAGAAFSAGISGGNTSGDTGTVSNQLVFAGGNNITLSGSTNAGGMTLSISGPNVGGAQTGISGLQVSNTTYTSGTVTFQNANGISFGSSGANGISASYTVPSTAGLLSAVNISAGTTSNNLSALVLSNSNGLSFGLNGSTITGSYTVPTQSNQTGGIYGVGNTTGQSSSSTYDARSLSIDGGGIVSVGWSNGTLRLSATQSNQAFSADASSTFQTLTLQNSNGISFSNNAGAIRLTHELQFTSATSAITSNALNTSVSRVINLLAATNNTGGGTASLSSNVSFSNANGATFYTSAGNAIVLSYSVPTQTNQTINFFASSQTTGQSSSSTVDARSVTIRGAGGVSVGMSGGELIISGAAGGGGGGTLSIFAQSNTTQSSSGTAPASSIMFAGAGIASVGVSNGSVVVSVPAGGGAGMSLGISTQGNTAGTTGLISNQMLLVGSGPMTLSQSVNGQSATLSVIGPAISSLSATGLVSISTNGSTISIGVPGNTASFFNPPTLRAQSTSVAIGNGSVFIQPFEDMGEVLSLSRFNVFANMSISSSSNSSHAGALSLSIGIYTRNGSTLSLASSGSQSYQWTNTSNNSMASISSIRRFSIPMNALISGGDYWIALASRSTTTNANWFTGVNMRASIMTNAVQGLIGEVSNSTRQLAVGFGLWSTTTTALPASIAISDIRGVGAANNALPFIWNAGNFTL